MAKSGTKKTGPVVPNPHQHGKLRDKVLEVILREAKEAGGDFDLSISDILEDAGASAPYVKSALLHPEFVGRVKDSIGELFPGKKFEISVTNEGISLVTEDGSLEDKKTAKTGQSKSSDDEIPEHKNYFFVASDLKKKIQAILKANMNLWISGPTGTGKSETAQRILDAEGHRYIKISFNGESSTDDLIGHYVLGEGNAMKWIDGALPRAMKEGWVLICEEIDAAPAECNLALQRALETNAAGRRHFFNTRNGGEEIESAPGFQIIATANTTGGGDHSGLYAGVQTQNAAFRDRFVFLEMDYLPRSREITVLTTRYPILDGTVAAKLVEFAEAVRVGVRNNTLFTPVSTRTLVACAQCYEAFRQGGLGHKKALTSALDAAIYHKASSPTDAKALREIAQRILGNEYA